MKKLYFLIVVLLMNILPIYAQLSLTLATHGYKPGDVYNYYFGDTTNFNPGAGGANVTWTFNTWTIIPNLNTINYIAPANTPYAASFPSATFAWKQEGSYVYYKAVTAGYFTEGVADSSLNLILLYTDDERMYPYPFTYNATYIDNFSGIDTVAGNKVKRTGKITTQADGWGKLVINGKTYTNVLRVKLFEELSKYQINVSTGDTGVAEHYKTTTYHWYRSDSKNPIINYSEIKMYQNKVIEPPYKITKEIFVDPAVTGINENNSELINFTIYPNPGKGLVNLESNISKPQILNIEIININGQVVYRDVINVQTGILNHTIDASTLTQGIYSVKIFSNEVFGIRKLIIQ